MAIAFSWGFVDFQWDNFGCFLCVIHKWLSSCLLCLFIEQKSAVKFLYDTFLLDGILFNPLSSFLSFQKIVAIYTSISHRQLIVFFYKIARFFLVCPDGMHPRQTCRRLFINDIDMLENAASTDSCPLGYRCVTYGSPYVGHCCRLRCPYGEPDLT